MSHKTAPKRACQRDNPLVANTPAPLRRGFFLLESDELEEFKRHARRHPNDLGRSPLGAKIVLAMRAACPVPGDGFDKFLSVWIAPTSQRQQIQPHEHSRHTMLYYPEPAYLYVNKERHDFSEGELIYLPPFTQHSLEAIQGERFSCAMLVPRVT